MFQQPSASGITGNLVVPLAPGGSVVPKSQFVLVLWQPNPSTSNGLLVPTGWNAGSVTGFTPSAPLSAQLAFQNITGASTAQMEGDAVGAYLNSNNVSPAAGGQKMMITPQFEFAPGSEPMPFVSSTGTIGFGLDLQVPTAGGEQAYICLDYEFVATNGVRISYNISLFHNTSRNWQNSFGYDVPSNSYMVITPLGWDTSFASPTTGSASATGVPWSGWRHFGWTISQAQFVAALQALATQFPSTPISTDPAQYSLLAFHLNAEIHYTTPTPTTEMGWSMRAATFTLQ